MGLGKPSSSGLEKPFSIHMPRLTEVEKLVTSGSYGDIVRSAQKCKYHLSAELSPGKVKIVSSALLQIGNLISVNQPGGGISTKYPDLPQVGNLNQESSLQVMRRCS